MPTIAPTAAQTCRREACVRRTRPVSLAVAALKVCAKDLSDTSGSSMEWQLWSRYQHQSAASPQGFWSRMESVCQLGTVNARMPRAAAGPQGASIRMPATTVPVRRGNSPALTSPAHLLPTVPGATGLPGVLAVTHVDLKGNRVALGMSLGDKGLLPGMSSLTKFLGTSWFHQ